MENWKRNKGNGKASPALCMSGRATILHCCLLEFLSCLHSNLHISSRRAMLSKERAVDMYRISAYFMARTTSDLPLDLFLPVVFLLIVYFMAGLRLSVGPCFLTMLTVFLCIVAAQGFGLVIGAIMMDVKRAMTLASVTVMTFMLAGGFFLKKVLVFISWIRCLSFNYHTYRLLLKVQYEHITTSINGMKLDSGLKEVCAMEAMAFGYRLLAYLSLRKMKLQSGS
ncbi:hypothetical protein HHK36_032185 [Tetracentron sinense]|uniref:ABC-2 type transporter transmembrane domain-containing protein n=1 Tax=Tetracentron sinense TaxID=13715 RepID=A0A835CXV6_TETSI|nr:hypothetical protein HHK36_032185 [Tetracentron sinense]